MESNGLMGKSFFRNSTTKGSISVFYYPQNKRSNTRPLLPLLSFSFRSIQADIPFRRISTLFNVTNFIVAQVNFHVVPFLHKPHHPYDRSSSYWRLFQAVEWDMRNRVLNLSRLGLFPKLFGHDVSKMFQQKYHGNVTLVPRMQLGQIFGIKALLNPEVSDMEHYIQRGQEACWPYVKYIKHRLDLEKELLAAVRNIEDSEVKSGRRPRGGSEEDFLNVFMDSPRKSGNNRVRTASGELREIELLKHKLRTVEDENERLSALVENYERREEEENMDSRTAALANEGPSTRLRKSGILKNQ